MSVRKNAYFFADDDDDRMELRADRNSEEDHVSFVVNDQCVHVDEDGVDDVLTFLLEWRASHRAAKERAQDHAKRRA